MTQRLVLTITDDQHALLSAVAQREGGSAEQWVLSNALGLAAMVADELRIRIEPRRSPRRDEGAESNPTTAHMMSCPHCRIETRAVKTCDNCDRRL